MHDNPKGRARIDFHDMIVASIESIGFNVMKLMSK